MSDSPTIDPDAYYVIGHLDKPFATGEERDAFMDEKYPPWFITIFERLEDTITRTHFADIETARAAWLETLDRYPHYQRIAAPSWSKKMKSMWKDEAIHERPVTFSDGWSPNHVLAIELCDRSLWSKDKAED